MRKSFNVQTYGCQMNKHDSERISGILLGQGYLHTKDLEAADIIVFNTCCVRESASERLLGNLGKLKPLKEKKPHLIIAVGGCFAQKERSRIYEKASHVDIVFGSHNLTSLPRLIKEAEGNGSSICEIWEEAKTPFRRVPIERESKYHAWVPISIGCDNYCTYCVVPYVRGKEISRRREDIYAEVKRVVAGGVVEITLLGQNVNSYGKDLYGKSCFASLLAQLDQIEGLERIRFITSHPRDFDDDTIEAIVEGEKICEHIHLPVQVGSTRILSLMNRDYTKEDYLELVEKIRWRIPEVSITADIMVGFPTETEKDFQETLEVVGKSQFDQAFTFLFSPRAGTPAAKMEGQITKEEKLERFGRLVALQKEVSWNQNQKLKGQVKEVLVEGRSKKNKSFLTGRTRTNKIVNFPGSLSLIHQLIGVTIKEAYSWYLLGALESS